MGCQAGAARKALKQVEKSPFRESTAQLPDPGGERGQVEALAEPQSDPCCLPGGVAAGEPKAAV